MKKSIRVAILHDWLVSWRGGEKCLQVISEMYDDVDIYTLFVDPQIKEKYISKSNVFSGLLSRLPASNKIYRYLLLFFPIDTLFLSRKLRLEHERNPYDIVISISHCAVKNISTPEGVPHLSYCLTPMRYIWDQYERYFSNKWYEPLFRPIRYILQKWDSKGAQNVSHFVAISDFISGRISRYYSRRSSVVYPPVEIPVALNIKSDATSDVDNDFYLMVNALVPYKNTEIVVKAFSHLPYKLKIVGTGPEEARLKALSDGRVEFLARVSEEELSGLYESSRALIFAAEEDFGITPVEAQAHGKPVICLGLGGCLETVILEGTERTGLAFHEASADAVKSAIEQFEVIRLSHGIDSRLCYANAKKFSKDQFIRSFSAEVEMVLEKTKFTKGIKRKVKEVTNTIEEDYQKDSSSLIAVGVREVNDA